MFNTNNVTEYQLEITTYCNAACPQCPRNINGGEINPHLHLTHLSRNIIDKAFTGEICKTAKRIFFCGSYGDPIMHPEFLDILFDFRNKNPNLWLFMHTNGSAFDTDFWSEIAHIMNGYGHIEFNIDGLEDTNDIYRRKTNFNKIIENAKAFIDAGGKAKWNFIAFKHNEHQVEEARKLSKQLGFEEFNVRATGRFLNHNTLTEVDEWPIMEKDTVVDKLEIPVTTKFKNSSTQKLNELDNNYFNNTTIYCDALNCNPANKRYNKSDEVKVVVNADGWVMPCNFFNHNLSDARFYNKEILPSSNDLSFIDGKNQVRDLFERHDADNKLNIHKQDFNTIFESSFWTELLESFNKELGKGRIFECAMTCGDKLNKVWDQTMKKTFLVTGGSKGLGAAIVDYYDGISVARGKDNTFVADITNNEDIERIAQESLQYDVFINNAFDGPPGNPWANFAQTNLLLKVYDVWMENNKTGHIINIGSVGEKDIVSAEPSFERYRISKSALAYASKQATRAFKDNIVGFKTTLISPDRLDTELTRSRDSWTGNGISLDEMIRTIDYILSSPENTCVEDITLWVNFQYNV